MAIEMSYWVYAAIQTLLFLISATGAVFYAFWAWESRISPRPTLWWLLPFIAAMDVGLAVDAGKWILVRAFNTEHSVGMIQAVKSAQNYMEYAVTRGFLLTVAALQVWPMWRVRKHRGSRLSALFLLLVVISIAAAFHHRQIEDYCAGPPSCALP